MSAVSAAPRASKSRTAQKYTFLTTAKYFQTLQARIEAAGAGDRLTLVTLRLKAEEPAVEKLVNALCEAAQRGADITLLVDAYHILIKEGAGEVPGLTILHKSSSKHVPKFMRRRQDALGWLQQAGVRCEVLNRPSRLMTSPFRGRSHIKFTVINDNIFIGGCNLDDPSYIDAMVSWRDKDTAGWLHALADSFVRTGRVSTALGGRDLEVPIDAHTNLLIDAGTSDQSIIMDRAYDIIDHSRKQLLITYQFFPHGPALTHLTQAVSRGVQLKSYYNHPTKHRYPYNLIYGVVAWQMRRTSLIEFSTHRMPKQSAYLHAKILTSEQGSMISSHNYMITGVELGTAEIALASTDPGFARQLQSTLFKQIN